MPKGYERIAKALLPMAAAIRVVGALAACSGGSDGNGEAAPGGSRSDATATPAPTATPIPPPPVGLLDGVVMKREEWNARRDLLPIAVMLDNAPLAYPHTGLDKADLVIEAFVEYRITRFMAVYWRQEAELIEPVRSARTPFLIWVSELGTPIYAHMGKSEMPGPADAASQILEWKIFDIEGVLPDGKDAPGMGFTRNRQRFAPHNMFTSTAALREVANRLGYKGSPKVEGWRYKDDLVGTSALAPAVAMEIDYAGGWPGTAGWTWDPVTNSYLRSQADKPHLDGATGQQLAFKNVVVVWTEWHIADEGGHVLYRQTGSGPLQVFLDGRMVQGEWRKQDRTSRIRFFDGTGAEIALNRGPTWVHMIGPGEGVLVASGAP